jgi:hypothetical protein
MRKIATAIGHANGYNNEFYSLEFAHWAEPCLIHNC